MLSFWDLKGFCVNRTIVLFFIAHLLSGFGYSQKDSLPYTLFKDKVVLFSDIGYTTAPFNLLYSFIQDIDKIKYRNKFRTVIGLGVSYKWFSLRVSIPLPGYMKAVSRYGETTPLNLGLDFSAKKTYWDIDLRQYKGYVIKDAYRWDDSLNSLHPNDIRPNTTTASFSLNGWYFHNPHFRMDAIKGRTGHYEKQVHTWYIKGTINGFGVGNDKKSVVPSMLSDSLNSKTYSSFYTSVDAGFVPGYAYVNRIRNWQFSGMVGFGAVLQGRFYEVDQQTRGVVGIAPRYDIRFIGGYSVPRFFVFLITDFDNKSIGFDDFTCRQYFYTLRIAGGIRLLGKDQRNSGL